MANRKKNNNKNLNLALQRLDLLNDTIGSLSVETHAAHNAIKTMKHELTTKKQTAEAIDGTVKIATTVVVSINNLKSNDPIKVALGIVDIMGSIASSGVFGPYGQAAGALCSLVSSILPLFGSKQKSMADVVKEVIDQAFEDYKDEAIDEKLQIDTDIMNNELTFLNTVAIRGGIMHGNQKDRLQNPFYQRIGLGILNSLATQIKRHGYTNKDSKAKKVAKYMYQYCIVSTMRSAVMTLLCSLLKVNGMYDILEPTLAVLKAEQMKKKQLLNFIYSPNKQNRKVYRYIQTTEVLNADQKILMQKYRLIIKCEPMAGFYCDLYNFTAKQHLYAATYKCYDGNSRNLFTWRGGNGRRVDQGGWRILPTKDGGVYYIYNIYHGEYLYGSDSVAFDTFRRRVFTWRKHDIASDISKFKWIMKTYKGGVVSIQNGKSGEYLCTHTEKAYDNSRRHVCTWRKKNEGFINAAYWEIRGKSPIGDLSNYQFH